MMNKNLNVGDVVTLDPETRWKLNVCNPIDINGVVFDVNDWIWVEWDNQEQNAYKPNDEDLILVKEKYDE